MPLAFARASCTKLELPGIESSLRQCVSDVPAWLKLVSISQPFIGPTHSKVGVETIAPTGTQPKKHLSPRILTKSQTARVESIPFTNLN